MVWEEKYGRTTDTDAAGMALDSDAGDGRVVEAGGGAQDAGQLAFWAGLHAAVMAAVCESCMGTVREAVRSYCREHRFDEAAVL